MRQRLLTFALVVGCAALFAVSAILTMAEDKKAPVITIEDKDKEITYRDGDDYAELLDGVTAKDNRDGDVTDQIFVDSITAVSDGTRAIVRYAVIDKSNNVGIKTRVIDYESTGESGQDAGQTADNEDSNSDQSEAKSEEQKQEEAKKEDTASDTANTEDTKEDTSKDKTDAENTNEGELKPNGVNPAIRLTESARTIKVGETFDILSVIDQVVDDQDDVSVLSRRIHAGDVRFGRFFWHQVRSAGVLSSVSLYSSLVCLNSTIFLTMCLAQWPDGVFSIFSEV